MRKSLKNKKCLVTGASKGIGKSIVKKLLESDAIVIASSSNANNLEKIKKDFMEYEHNLFTYQADLSIPNEVQDLCKSIQKDMGGIEVLVNNAGILHLESLESSVDEILRRSFEVNYFSAFAICRFFAPQMVDNKEGVIINICSSSSYTGGDAPNHSIYASTKHRLWFGPHPSLAGRPYLLEREAPLRRIPFPRRDH